MGLIRAHGAYFGFCFEGRDRWIERKSEEDYSVLYYDEGQKDKLFVAMEQAVRGDSEKWARKMSELDGEFARLRLRNGDLGPGPKENVVEKTKEGYEIKERWY